MRQSKIRYLVIDLFCGAGGTTLGFETAMSKDPRFKLAKVIACVNHDHLAIKSHWSNHPDVEHFEEDIRHLDPYGRLRRLVEIYRAFYPEAKVILWASLECTNFSKAKGGLPRDADSRTLAEYLYKYILALNPDFIQIENVVEFMSWGPLDDNGKPISRKNGQDWIRWREKIKSFGYHDDWKELNAADFGALTSRNRLFGCFARIGTPIVWPAATHTKKPEKSMYDKPLKKWRAVKEALDFSDEGNSIFNRKKNLSEKTMQRLFMGCVKHIAGGKNAFLQLYNSNKPEEKGGGNYGRSIEDPAPTIGTRNQPTAVFLDYYYGNGSTSGISDPAGTIVTKDRIAKVQATFIDQQFSQGKQNQSIEEPLGAITTVPKSKLVQAEHFIANGNPHNTHTHSVENPSPTLTAGRHHHYIVNPTWFNEDGARSIEEPCFVVIARQDKAPLYLITCKEGPVAVPVYEDDCEWTVKLKEFMALYDICDIKMRMLKVIELKVIQGFPADYVLLGNQTDQKKFIGNAVEKHVPAAMIEAMEDRELREAA